MRKVKVIEKSNLGLEEFTYQVQQFLDGIDGMEIIKIYSSTSNLITRVGDYGYYFFCVYDDGKEL